jgi:hypothetical protein
MKLNIMGTEYKISFRLLKDDDTLKDCDGYCDSPNRTIVVREYTKEEQKTDNMTDNLTSYANKVLRHEIIHAFFYESGLSGNSMQYSGAWARNEEMVDWIAIQLPKLLKAFQEANCL